MDRFHKSCDGVKSPDGAWVLYEDAEAAVAEVRRQTIGTLIAAKRFIEYARYELQPGKAIIGSQFPHQEDADEAIAGITAVIVRAQAETRHDH